ncbi:unnamed protein product [Echinostoma caproni]|uniref:Uncharacterized protein n=1 Tax=Echinostoma caproni TaxID=27848 RepID=A0A183B6I0_9TREM|nr:unnamed protein product [Echinostoma caproni]
MPFPKVLGTHLKKPPFHLSSSSYQSRKIPNACCLLDPSEITQHLTSKFKESEVTGFLKPKFPSDLAAFNVRTLYRMPHMTTRKSLKRQLIKSLGNDREKWWVEKCRDV